jgi:hypothetical protein
MSLGNQWKTRKLEPETLIQIRHRLTADFEGSTQFSFAAGQTPLSPLLSKVSFINTAALARWISMQTNLSRFNGFP